MLPPWKRPLRDWRGAGVPTRGEKRANTTGHRRRTSALVLACIALIGVALVTILVLTVRHPNGRTIEVDPHPVAFTIDQDNERAYVISARSDSVSVLNTRLATLIHVVHVGPGPQRVLVAGRIRRAFVVNYGSGAGSVSVLDATNGRLLRTTSVGASATNAVVDALTGHVFIATARYPGREGRIVMLDARDGRPLGAARVGAEPTAMAVSERTGRVFVVNTGSGTVSVLDTRTGALIRTITIGWLPSGVVVDEHARHAFIVDSSDNAVVMLDARDGRLLRRASVGHDPGAIVIDEQVGRAFVTAMGDGSVNVLDTANGRSVGTLHIDRGVSMMIIAAWGRRLLVGDKATGTIHSFDARTLTPLRTASVGPVPFAGAADDRRGLAVVTALGATDREGLPVGPGAVAVLDAMSGSVLRRRVTGPAPYFVGVDERSGHVFVVDGSQVRKNNTWNWVPQAIRRWLALPSSTTLVSSARVIIFDDTRH